MLEFLHKKSVTMRQTKISMTKHHMFGAPDLRQSVIIVCVSDPPVPSIRACPPKVCAMSVVAWRFVGENFRQRALFFW